MSLYTVKTGIEILLLSMVRIIQVHHMEYETKKRINVTLDMLERETYLGYDFISEIYKLRRLYRSLENIHTRNDEHEFDILSDQIQESIDKCIAIMNCY